MHTAQTSPRLFNPAAWLGKQLAHHITPPVGAWQDTPCVPPAFGQGILLNPACGSTGRLRREQVVPFVKVPGTGLESSDAQVMEPELPEGKACISHWAVSDDMRQRFSEVDLQAHFSVFSSVNRHGDKTIINAQNFIEER
ncbi:hypothetical protein [Microbulbifer sp.]|uniref:hypothetical protein n=1 Tax=Microbulbifer sp. TaxID=1908541 RepID=UPI003F4037FE